MDQEMPWRRAPSKRAATKPPLVVNDGQVSSRGQAGTAQYQELLVRMHPEKAEAKSTIGKFVEHKTGGEAYETANVLVVAKQMRAERALLADVGARLEGVLAVLGTELGQNSMPFTRPIEVQVVHSGRSYCDVLTNNGRPEMIVYCNDIEDSEVTICAVALAGGDNAPGRVGTTYPWTSVGYHAHITKGSQLLDVSIAQLPSSVDDGEFFRLKNLSRRHDHIACSFVRFLLTHFGVQQFGKFAALRKELDKAVRKVYSTDIVSLVSKWKASLNLPS